MKTLDRKLLRDLRAMWAQALAIAADAGGGARLLGLHHLTLHPPVDECGDKLDILLEREVPATGSTRLPSTIIQT